jgi:hypothetical protein
MIQAALMITLLRIVFPTINDFVDVLDVPNDTDLGVFRSQPSGIDSDNSIYRKLIIHGSTRAKLFSLDML